MSPPDSYVESLTSCKPGCILSNILFCWNFISEHHNEVGRLGEQMWAQVLSKALQSQLSNT